MIFENPFKYRRKGERRKISRISLGIFIIIGGMIFSIITATYFTKVPPPIHINTVNTGAVFDTKIFQEMKKKVAIHAISFSQSTKNTNEENPNQKIINKRIQTIKKIPSLLDKSFLFTTFISGTNPIYKEDITHIQQLDIVFPDWFTLNPSGCTTYESIDWNTFEILNKNRIITIPRFSNTTPLGGKTDFSDILRIEGQGICLIDNLKKNVKNRATKGIQIDIDDIQAVDRNRYTAWLLSLVESFHKDGLFVAVTVPIDNLAFDYKNIGAIADLIIVKAYDEHSLGGIPGPIASTHWFEGSINTLLQIIPSSKVIITLGLHGYDWNLSTDISPERKDFDTTMHLVENTKAKIQWDMKSKNSNFSYMADDGSYHEVWFLDAVSVWNQYIFLEQKQVHGISLAFMGNEDSSIWKFIHTGALSTFDPRALSIPTREGVRELVFSGKTVIRSNYLRLPKDSTISYNTILGIPMDIFEPLVPIRERLSVLWDIFTSNIKQWIWYFLVTLFIVTTVVSISRIIFLGIFVFRSNTFRKKCFPRKFLNPPPVTILVPAYNEEKVIKRTILGLLSSKYPEFEILVIDDGSTDKTAECVRKLIKKYPNVRLISKKNEGKSLALNVGFKEARYDYVVTVDADTIVLPKTVQYLMEPFSESKVDAVCGNIGVGNVKNILTAFQEVEYVTGQNYDRHAFDALNCISVVPGATGAWKKQKVLDIGGYSGDTLVEDADLTLTLLENGGRIVYAPLARSVTEAPERVVELFKQRFRWSYGTFQCFWKHRRTFGKGSLGLIALPNMLLFQVIFPLLCPIGDIVLIAAVFLGNLQPILIGYVLFFFMDAIVSGTAYVLDKKSVTHIWVIFIQRFFYRQFMYLVTFKSIIAALSGNRHGWNKLERKGSVEIM